MPLVTSRFIAVCATLLLLTSTIHAQDAPVLVMENGGLKNTYRGVFEEIDETNHFVRGAFEILDDDDGREKPHTRIPFSGGIKADAKSKKTEVLEVSCTAAFAFFPPSDKSEPIPTVKWKLTGRKSGKPELVADLWEFDADKKSWVIVPVEFEKAP